ncbi:unnamed protein product [Sphagnum tenellum]
MLKNFVEGVAVVKVLAAPFGPELVKNEGAEDVERLPEVGETASVVSVEAGRVVLVFDGGLSEQDEWPVDGGVLGSLPFLPDSPKNHPSALRGRAVQEVMLGDSRVPVSHVLQVGGIPITCSQVPVGRPWLKVSGYFEGGTVLFLQENSNQEVVVEKGVDLVACGSILAAGRSSPEFQR